METRGRQKKIVLTRAMVDAINGAVDVDPELRRIAQRLGCTVGSLRGQCYKQGISLRRYNGAIKLRFCGDMRMKIEGAAERRGMTAPALLERIIGNVFNDGMLDAVLEE